MKLIGILERSPAEKSRGETSAPISRPFLLATVYAQKKDEAKAQGELRRRAGQGRKRGARKSGGRAAPRVARLIYAGLGRCEEAMAEAKRAVELLPEAKDAFDGPILVVTPRPHHHDVRRFRDRARAPRSIFANALPASRCRNCDSTRCGIALRADPRFPADADEIRQAEP